MSERIIMTYSATNGRNIIDLNLLAGSLFLPFSSLLCRTHCSTLQKYFSTNTAGFTRRFTLTMTTAEGKFKFPEARCLDIQYYSFLACSVMHP